MKRSVAWDRMSLLATNFLKDVYTRLHQELCFVYGCSMSSMAVENQAKRFRSVETRDQGNFEVSSHRCYQTLVEGPEQREWGVSTHALPVPDAAHVCVNM